MRQRNKLYTVNKYNRTMFLPEGNMFLDGGAVVAADQLASEAYGANYGDEGFTLDDYMSSTNAFGISKADNPFSKMNLKGGIGAMASTPIGGALISGAAGAIGGLANNAISGGLESGAGSAISGIGSTVGSAVGAVNPVLGAAVSVGSQVLGGLTNAAFGIKEDAAKKKAVEEGINQNINFVSNASSFDDVKGPAAVMTNTDVYKGGWFSGGKARRKNEELKRRMIEARSFANRSVDNNVSNLQDDQINDALANFAAYGGPLGGFGSGALGIMQNDKYLDSVNYRSDAIANHNTNGYGLGAFTGGAKTFDNGGTMLKYDFINDFSSDPIGAVMRYNKGLEDLAAREELLRQGEQRAAEYAAMQQGLEDLRMTPPNFSINITQDYGVDGIPQAPKIDVQPILPNTITRNPELGLSSIPSKAASKGYIYDELPQLLKDAGLDVKVTSGYREAGKAGKAGDKSWHHRHGAVDIVPQGNTTFEDIEKAVLTNPEIRQYMMNNGYGYLDETDRTPEGKLLMQKTGATGNHLHFGRDTKARERYQKLANISAFGGELGTNGTDWYNGLLQINEGGSHEENPFDGVPMGVDAEGIPNLVEEGETVYNDYVFSDRMDVPNFMLKELGLPNSKKKISFADASKKLAQESEQRPNDPISQDGLQASLSKLAEIQETERMRKQAKEYMGLNGYACGGKMGRKFAPGGYLWDDFLVDDMVNPVSKMRGNSKNKYMADPFYNTKDVRDIEARDEYKNFTDYMLNKASDDERMNYFKWIDANTGRDNKYINNGKLVDNWEDMFQNARTDGLWGIQHYTPDWKEDLEDVGDMTPEEEGLLPEEEIFEPDYGDPEVMQQAAEYGLGTYQPLQEGTYGLDKNPKKYATWMRYAPAVGAGIMTLTDALGLTNKPDYTYADKIAGYAERAGVAPQVSYKPIGNYLTYRPMDIWFEQNRMDANARATDRAIMNSASPSRMAGLIANSYNSQIADGELYRKALEYNDAKRERVADFNRKTNMFNSQMGLEAAMANARYTQAARQMGLSGLAQAAALRDSIDARVGASRSANLSNFLTSLGNIGRENFALNQINTDRSRNYTTTASGKQGYKRKNK